MTATCHGPDGVALSREEAWVLHAALLARIERAVAADRSPDHAVDVLDRVERCEALGPADRGLVRDALSDYLDGAPERDRAPARRVLATLATGHSSSSQ